MSTYKFKALQSGSTSACFVVVECNGLPIEVHNFQTPEWALFFKRTCEALDKTRFPVGVVTWPSSYTANGATAIGSHVYTKEEVDALLRRITSLEHWLEPLRAKARRFYELAMWGERGRI